MIMAQGYNPGYSQRPDFQPVTEPITTGETPPESETPPSENTPDPKPSIPPAQTPTPDNQGSPSNEPEPGDDDKPEIPPVNEGDTNGGDVWDGRNSKDSSICDGDFFEENKELIKKLKNILDFIYPNSGIDLAKLLTSGMEYICGKAEGSGEGTGEVSPPSGDDEPPMIAQNPVNPGQQGTSQPDPQTPSPQPPPQSQNPSTLSGFERYRKAVEEFAHRNGINDLSTLSVNNIAQGDLANQRNRQCVYDDYNNPEFTEGFVNGCIDDINNFVRSNYAVNATYNIRNEPEDFLKILYVHDYLAAYIRYDDNCIENLNNADCKITNFSAYFALKSALRKRNISDTAICAGYSRAFMLLMFMLGINECEVYFVEGEHEWNKVKLGNSYYWLDATWDSFEDDHSDYYAGFYKTVTIDAQVIHNYFLIGNDTRKIAYDQDSWRPRLYYGNVLPLPSASDYLADKRLETKMTNGGSSNISFSYTQEDIEDNLGYFAIKTIPLRPSSRDIGLTVVNLKIEKVVARFYTDVSSKPTVTVTTPKPDGYDLCYGRFLPSPTKGMPCYYMFYKKE